MFLPRASSEPASVARMLLGRSSLRLGVLLIVLRGAITLHAQTVWSGAAATANWSDWTNWSSGTPSSQPAAWFRFPITVPGSRSPVVDKNDPWVVNKLEFFGEYHFAGNAISFEGSAPLLSGGSSVSTTFENDMVIPTGTLKIEGNGLTPTVLSGRLSGNGGIVSTVRLTLSGESTLTGPIIFQPYSGLKVTNSHALGPADSAPVEIRSCALELNGGITVEGKALLLGTNGGYNQGLISSGGANTWTGRVDVLTNSYVKANTLSDRLTISGPIDGHDQPYLDILGDGDITIAGAISRITQAVDKSGKGTLVLSGNNSFSGSLYLTKGTVVLRGGNAIADDSAVLLEVSDPDHATLRLESDETIGSMRGQNVDIDLGDHELRINQLYNLIFRGTAHGTGRIVKAGLGSLELYSPNTHTGGTIIEAGMLKIRDDACLGAPGAPVAMSAGTLQWSAPTPGTLAVDRTITLTQDGGAIDAGGQILTIPGKITGPGAFGRLGTGTVVLTNPDNDYAGGTFIVSGALVFQSPGAIAGTTRNIMLGSGGQAVTAYPMDQSFLLRITSDSTGLVALGSASANDLDFAEAGLQDVRLGALAVQEFGGTLHPANGLYRLGGAGSLRLTKTGVLNGSAALEVSGIPNAGSTVILSADSTIGGSIDVTAGVLEIQKATISCSTLKVHSGAILLLTSGNAVAQRITVDSGGILRGCGAIDGELVNNGNVEVTCGPSLQVSGAITNNGTFSVLNDASLVATGSMVNNGYLDLLVSSGTVLPTTVVNTGTIVRYGELKVRGMSARAGRFQILVSGVPNHFYQLQRRQFLTSGDWQNVGGSFKVWTSADVTLSDSYSGAPGFYRVQAQ